ncbi:MAG: YceI family protein [Bacteroidota bacterium]
MKKFNSFFAMLLAASALVGFSFTVVPNLAGNYSVNVAESNVEWKGYKVTGEHSGTINVKAGDLTFGSNGELTGGNVTIDMASIKCTDLEGEWADKLVGHLKSDDFFGVGNFPTAELVITKVAPKGTPGDYKVTGNLKIKETTKEIRFYAHLDDAGNSVNATADLKIDRTDFDVRYGSGSFFDNLGDKTIYDEFDLTVNLKVTK